MIVLLLFAMLAGLVTVLSPCILPVLPILLSAGVAEGKLRPLGIIIGLILSFTFFTLTLTAIVHATGISPDILRYISIFIIGFFGATMLFPAFGNKFAQLTSGIAALGNTVQEKSNFAGNGFTSGLILGVALGLIWTPCAGPILATITTIVATHSINLDILFITLAYSLGAAIPMLCITYGGSKIINSTQSISGYTETIRKIFGVLMILGALAIAFHFDVILQQITLKYFPVINVESNETLKKELDKLRSNVNPNLASNTEPNSKAPEFTGITEWLNSPALTIDSLKGKVFLVDFWTYSCINCVRTLPYIKDWYNKYKDYGFTIIGVHTPEFEFEKNKDNIKNAIKRFEINYPVAVDSNYQTWLAYNNRYWPAHYLFDKNGIKQYVHFGEGEYLKTENAIRNLLDLPPLQENLPSKTFRPITPETYLGYARANSYNVLLEKDIAKIYDYKTTLGNNQVGLKGSWLIKPEYIESQDNNAILELDFIASKVYLVMESKTSQNINVLLDDKPYGQIPVNEARMYNIIDLKENYGRYKLTLQFPKDVLAYVFTFGG